MPRNSDLRQSLLAELHDQQPFQKKRKLSREVPKHELFASITRASREKRYEDAERLLEQYRDGADGADQIDLLELQTDLQMKLDKPALALETSKKMIRLARDDPRGYLRAAQALESKSDLRSALKYIDHGIKNSSTRHGSCAKLIARVSHLKAMISSNVVFEKAADRIHYLPPELLDMVFAYLDYRDCTIILRVSKLWQQRVLSSDIMSNVIDFRHSRCSVSVEHVRSAFRRTRSPRKELYLHHLNASAWRYVNTEFVKWYQWSSLEVLDVDSSQIALPSHFFPKACKLRVVRAPGLPVGPRHILSDCQNLESLRMPCYIDAELNTTAERILRSRLKHLTFTDFTRSDSVSQILDRYSFPNLEHLALLGDARSVNITNVDLSSHPKLDTLVVQGVRVVSGWAFPPALRTLRFTPLAPGIITGDISSINIEILEIGGACGIMILKNMISGGLSSNSLRDLTLRNVAILGEPDADFEEILQGGLETQMPFGYFANDLESHHEIFANVESLKLCQENLCDKHSGVVLRLFPRLRNLEVQSPRVTSLFFSDIIRGEYSPSRLETIRLKECVGVDKDLVPWAKARGVTVSIAPTGLPAERRPKSDAFW